MFRLLCGRLPFISTAGEMALGMMHLNKPAPLVSEFAPTVSSWLVDLVDRMLAKTPSARPTMAQVASELQERLPARPSSRSSIPAIKPDSGVVVVYQEALEPTEDAAGDADTRRLPPSVSGPLGRVILRSSGVPVALESRQSGAGTITRATGQGPAAKESDAVSAAVAGAGGFVLLASVRGAVWLLSASPVAPPSQPAAATTTNLGAGPQGAVGPAPSVGSAAQPVRRRAGRPPQGSPPIPHPRGTAKGRRTPRVSPRGEPESPLGQRLGDGQEPASRGAASGLTVSAIPRRAGRRVDRPRRFLINDLARMIAMNNPKLMAGLNDIDRQLSSGRPLRIRQRRVLGWLFSGVCLLTPGGRWLLL